MSAESSGSYPGFRQTFWPMLLLFCAAIIYSIDRSIVGVLAEPIRKDLLITDVQLGLLMGLAYSLLSGALGIFLGSLVDRHTRRTLLAVSILLWSLATVGCGLAPGFKSFFLFRTLVGLGEAAIAPAGISLIADLFPAHQRGRALSSYLVGASIGSGLSSVIPGLIIGANLHLIIPGFGSVAPWRSAFFLSGLVGAPISLLFLTVREPVRRGLRQSEAVTAHLTSKLAYLWRQRGLFAPLYIGFSLFYIAYTGVTMWSVAFISRQYHLSIASFAGRFGLMLLLAGVGGYVISGFVVDSKLGRRAGGKLLILAVLPLLALPSTLATFAPSVTVAVIMLAAIGLAAPILNVATNITVQESAPNHMRGFAYALLGLVTAVIAGVFGPLLIALATKQAGGPAFVGQSFLIVGVPALLGASICFLLARRATHGEARNDELADIVRLSRA